MGDEAFDFDPKLFFDEAPRMRDDARVYVRRLASDVLRALVTAYRRLPVEQQWTPRLIKLLLFLVCVDPITEYARGQLVVQAPRVKSTLRVLSRAVDDAVTRVADGSRHGGVDRKIVRGTERMLRDARVECSRAGLVACAAIVADVCGMVLHGGARAMEREEGSAITLTERHLREHAGLVQLTSGELYENASLLRFLSVVREWSRAETAAPTRGVAFDRA